MLARTDLFGVLGILSIPGIRGKPGDLGVPDLDEGLDALLGVVGRVEIVSLFGVLGRVKRPMEYKEWPRNSDCCLLFDPFPKVSSFPSMPSPITASWFHPPWLPFRVAVLILRLSRVALS